MKTRAIVIPDESVGGPCCDDDAHYKAISKHRKLVACAINEEEHGIKEEKGSELCQE